MEKTVKFERALRDYENLHKAMFEDDFESMIKFTLSFGNQSKEELAKFNDNIFTFSLGDDMRVYILNKDLKQIYSMCNIFLSCGGVLAFLNSGSLTEKVMGKMNGMLAAIWAAFIIKSKEAICEEYSKYFQKEYINNRLEELDKKWIKKIKETI